MYYVYKFSPYFGKYVKVGFIPRSFSDSHGFRSYCEKVLEVSCIILNY